MPRRPRHDRPGQFHHLMNRGTGGQVLFADRRDMRRFTALLICSVRRGEMQLAAYNVLSTHFHLLARSVEGSISFPLMRIQNAYVKYRNRRSGVKGALVSGRYRSKPVTTWAYFRTVVRYIDANPLGAGLCTRPEEYPYGSAIRYAMPRPPVWLDAPAIERHMQMASPRVQLTPHTYAKAFGRPASESEIEVVERRLLRPADGEDELDALLQAPPSGLARWMASKIQLAGKRSPWTPVASTKAVLGAIEVAREISGAWVLDDRRTKADAWSILECGLLRSLACLTISEIGAMTGCHRSTASLRSKRHRALMISDSVYAQRAGQVVRDALDATYR